jgi:energy-coupling factor transporter ATP-binding protein EcfA2
LELVPVGDPRSHQYVLFISFTDSDRSWVEGYLLPALGLPKERIITGQVTTRSETFRPGAAIVNEFARAVTASSYTVLALSRAYLTDSWSAFGEQLVSYVSVVEQQERLIPLLIERDCPLPLQIDFRVRLDCTQEENWKSAIERLRQLVDQPEPRPEHITCPYPGMVPFSEKDARFFHAREDEIKWVLQHFRHQRLLFVIGPSGCGKSSLIFAGLLPRLQTSSYFDEGFWLLRKMRPGSEPMKELARVVGSDIPDTPESVNKLLMDNPPARRLLLVVDQFEELFSQAARAEQHMFITAMKRLRTADNCALLITMRADFYPELMNIDLWQEVSSCRMELTPLRGEVLRRAIEKPASDVGVYLERGLADRLIVDAADEPGALPLLQEAMRLLWAEMKQRFLALRAYEQMGAGGGSGLAVAIAKKADAALNALSTDEQKAVARRIFLRLVQFGEGRPDTRRQQRMVELKSLSDDAQLFEGVLVHLVENRLLTLSGEEKDLEKRVSRSRSADRRLASVSRVAEGETRSRADSPASEE